MSWVLLPALDTLKPFSLELYLPPFSSSNILQPLHMFSLQSGMFPSKVAPLDYPGISTQMILSQRPPRDSGSSGYTSPSHPLLFSGSCPQTRIFYSFVWFCLIHIILLNQTGSFQLNILSLLWLVPNSY